MRTLGRSRPNTSNAITPLNPSIAATASSQPRKLPVQLRTSPITYGPRKPPRLPNELIRAIPATAEVSLNSSVEVAQNGPNSEYADSKVMLRKTIIATVEVEKAAQVRPKDPTNAEPAKCHRLSRVRSECVPITTIAMAVTR